MRPVARVAAAAAALSTIVLAAPATAAGDCYVARAATATAPSVVACQLDTWIAQGSQKAGNLAGAGQSTLPTWDTTKPTGQLEGGAGGGYGTVRLADIAEPGNTTFAPTFSGTYTGVLDNIAVDMFLVAPVYQASGGAYPLLATLTVDGVEVYSRPAEEVEVPMEATPAGNGQIARMRFAFTRLVDELEASNVANDATTEHEISFSLVPRYWGDAHTVFLYDEADVPSAVTFNQPGRIRVPALDTTKQ